MISSIWAYRSLSLIGDYDNLPTPFGEEPIFEGDPSIPDVQRRYGNQVPGVAGSLLRPDEAESAIIDLGTLLEQALSAKNAPTHVIVNLPGGAASTVDPLAADLISPLAAALDLEIVTVFLIGPELESAQIAKQSLTEGVAGISNRKIAVANLKMGDPSRFAWTTSNERKIWLAAGGTENALPALTARVMDKVRDLPGSFSGFEVGQTGDLSIVERSVIHRWRVAADPLCRAACGGEKPKLVFVHGEKGGVGKSVCSMLLIDHLLHPVEAVEDTKNEAEK